MEDLEIDRCEHLAVLRQDPLRRLGEDHLLAPLDADGARRLVDQPHILDLLEGEGSLNAALDLPGGLREEEARSLLNPALPIGRVDDLAVLV